MTRKISDFSRDLDIVWVEASDGHKTWYKKSEIEAMKKFEEHMDEMGEGLLEEMMYLDGFFTESETEWEEL